MAWLVTEWGWVPLARGESASETSGEVLTFEALYAAHAPAVFRWVRRLAGPSTDADLEDLVQEVFLRAHRALPGFRGDSQPRTWLFRIAARVVARNRRRVARPLADVEVSRCPEEDLSSREAETLLYRALDGLDPRARALLVAFELEDLSGAEIARALGIKQATLWVRLHRARLALQEELERLRAG